MVLVAVKLSLGTEDAARGAGQSSLVCFCWVLGLSLVEVNQPSCVRFGAGVDFGSY